MRSRWLAALLLAAPVAAQETEVVRAQRPGQEEAPTNDRDIEADRCDVLDSILAYGDVVWRDFE